MGKLHLLSIKRKKKQKQKQKTEKTTCRNLDRQQKTCIHSCVDLDICLQQTNSNDRQILVINM